MIINQLFIEKLVTILGWTILHSLWQGVVCGLALVVILLLLQDQSPKFKYNCTLLIALVFTLISVCTFGFLYHNYAPGQPTIIAVTSNDIISPVVLVPGNSNSLQEIQPWYANFIVLQRYLPLIVFFWGVGVLLLSIRFTGGLIYAQRLKSHALIPSPAHWQERVNQLAAKISVRQSIMLLQSAKVKIPLVIGYIKPVILLPLGYLTGLPQNQVEAILAHELAHISRKDYLVNIIYSMITILFFYHPVIWWITAIIRRERENCCDDLAIALTGDQITMARALSTVYEKQLTPATAMAFFQHKKGLLNRIKRITRKSTPEINPLGGALVSFLIIIGALIVFVNARAQFTQSNDAPPVPAPAIAPVDPLVINSDPAMAPLAVTNPAYPPAPVLSAPDASNQPDSVKAPGDIFIYDSSLPFSLYLESLKPLVDSSLSIANHIFINDKILALDSLTLPGMPWLFDSSLVVIPPLPENFMLPADLPFWDLSIGNFDSTQFQKAMENFQNFKLNFDTSQFKILTPEYFKNFNFKTDSLQLQKLMDMANNIRIYFDSTKVAEMQKQIQQFTVQVDTAQLFETLQKLGKLQFDSQEMRQQQLEQMEKQRELLDKQIEKLHRDIEKEQKKSEFRSQQSLQDQQKQKELLEKQLEKLSREIEKSQKTRQHAGANQPGQESLDEQLKQKELLEKKLQMMEQELNKMEREKVK
ncbi:MAG TPA: M56 family metallopeptidase [bacterium]|nr:M56 family metallopeptidase [bacterium]HPN43149.1 M56 family metallopeptidase [bacterium]